MDLEALSRIAMDGDRAALELLLQNIYPLVYRFNIKLLRGTQEAQDLTQAVMVRVIENLHKYRVGPGSFQSWVFRISYNLFVDYTRKHKPVPVRDELLARVADRRDAVRGAELRDEAQRLLLALSREERAMMVMRYYLDLEYKAIAAALGVGEARVKWRLHEAKERMRKYAEEAGKT
ncbi:MAG: sigma-70 family RNA polymerase sigma factor [Clostridiales bacterium]|nr:sigma-70 family RNA polymerase sigma factor [Clostridiales bacterium]